MRPKISRRLRPLLQFPRPNPTSSRILQFPQLPLRLPHSTRRKAWFARKRREHLSLSHRLVLGGVLVEPWAVHSLMVPDWRTNGSNKMSPRTRFLRRRPPPSTSNRLQATYRQICGFLLFPRASLWRLSQPNSRRKLRIWMRVDCKTGLRLSHRARIMLWPRSARPNLLQMPRPVPRPFQPWQLATSPRCRLARCWPRPRLPPVGPSLPPAVCSARSIKESLGKLST